MLVVVGFLVGCLPRSRLPLSSLPLKRDQHQLPDAKREEVDPLRLRQHKILLVT